MKRPILYIVIPFCAGIALERFFNIPLLIPIVLTAVFLVLAAMSFKKNILSHAFLYVALFFFGAAYYQNSNILPANHISNFASGEKVKAVIKGRIADVPVTSDAFYRKKRTGLTLEAEAIERAGWQKVTGLVKVSIYSDEEIKNIGFGDEVIMEGSLSKPHGLKNPGLFDYTEYLKVKNIYAVFSASGNDIKPVSGTRTSGIRQVQKAAYKLRDRTREAIKKYVDAPYSGFLSAILIGDRSDLDNYITDDFIKTGTVHVIAISGLNIALVAGIFIFIFKLAGVRRKSRLIITSIAIIFYCFVAGSSPPVIRATIIFVIYCLGYLIARESDMLNSLSIAAFFMLLWNPKELFDPSFQLSFIAVASVVLLAPKIEEVLKLKPNYFTKSISVSIAATAGVLPVVAKYFNIVTPIAMIANLIIIPALFVITAASFIFLFLNLIGAFSCLGWTGFLLSFFIKATFYLNHFLAQAPLSHIRVPAPSCYFILFYYIMLLSVFFIRRKKISLVLFLIGLNLFVWNGNFAGEKKLLKITFLDVGQGDCILLEFPDNGTMLIDGGSGGVEDNADMGRIVVAPYLWNKGIRRVDSALITHFHEDHLGGIPYLLKNFKMGCVMDNDAVPSEDRRLYNEYKRLVRKLGIRRLVVADGDEITGFTDVKLYVLNPAGAEGLGNPNDSSVVIKLMYKNFSALFCADISSEVMERLFSYGDLLESDILKIPHHGGSVGKKDVAARFYEKVSPTALVISSGGRYGLRDPSRVSLGLKTVNYSTYKNGAISVLTDGSSFEVIETSKGK